MYTDKITPRFSGINLFRWEIVVLQLLVFAIVGIYLDKPSGSISGKVALEQPGFHLYSYDMRNNKVYAAARGPRDGITIARGVWVNNDGTFRIDQLPIGEYSLEVRAPGFETLYKEGIFVTESKIQAIPEELKMNILEPSVTVASNMRVFTTAEPTKFWVRATGATEATIKIYKKDFLDTVASKLLDQSSVQVNNDFGIYASYGKKFVNPFSAETPTKQMKRDLVVSYTDSAKADFELPGLAPGDYFVVAEVTASTGNKHASGIWWFTVTDIGLVVKQAPEKTIVRALDLNTMKPAAGVEVWIDNSLTDLTATTETTAGKGQTPATTKFSPACKATTGSDGLVTLPFHPDKTDNYHNVAVVGRRGDHRAYGGSNFWVSGVDGYNSYFYSDRPVYRLGQTVFFKGIIRKMTGDGFKNIGMSIPVDVHIEDPSNVQLKEMTLNSSKHGTVNGSFEIPADGKTGYYQLQFTYPDGNKSYESIEVAQYRKPEYKIEIKPSAERFSAGTKVKAKLSASYFFGGPVANARVKYSVYAGPDYSTRYSLMPRPDYYGYFDDWNSESSSYDYEESGSYNTEGFAITDENGEATIEFDTKPIKADNTRPGYYSDYMDQSYKIEAEVTDISRLTVTGSSKAFVTAGDFSLFVNPSSYVVQVGEPIQSEIEALDYHGKPVANKKVKVTLSRWPWDSVNSTYKPEVVLTEYEATTNADGKAPVSFSVDKQWPTDTFYVTAEAVDDGGRTVCGGNSVWIASRYEPFFLSSTSADKESFRISMDKKVYKPGDTARAMVSGPFTGKEGYEAIVTVEGTKLHDYRIVPLNATATLVEIPIKPSYTPNVYLNVVVVTKKKQFFSKEETLFVSPQDHFLNVAVTTDKEKYKPGETAKYTLKATYKNGKPAPNTELSLGVVDESIYSIRGEKAADIQHYFYDRRANWVHTLYTFPEQYSGGPDKMADDMKVRKNFKDTASWIPNLITNGEGVAVASVVLPDNLTTWRATVRGVSMETDIGETTQKIMVTQDIIARLALPRFFTQGDQGEVSAIVHNYSDKNQTVHLSLWMSDQFKTNQGLTQNLTIEKDKAGRFVWPVTITKSGTGVVRLKARGEGAGDALERSLPINTFGIPMFASSSGVLTDEKPAIDIPIDQAAGASTSLSVSLAGSTIGQVKGSFSSLIDYPYGCTEQTMSRLVPSVVAMQLHGKLGVPLEKGSEAKFDKVLKLALEKLTDYHHDDGGWGWWKDDDSNPYLTALVLEGFHMLKQAGYTPPVDDMSKSALTWLNTRSTELVKQLQDPKLVEDWNTRSLRIELARTIYTMSLYRFKPEPKVLNWLRTQIPHYTPEPLSYLTLAYSKFGDNAAAQEAYDALIRLANSSKTTMDWEHSKEMLKKLGLKPYEDDYTYYYTGEETTALALRAVVAMEPNNLERIEMIKHFLLLHRSQEGWGNTKTTAEVMVALLDDALAQKLTDVGTSTTAKILMNSALAQEATFAASEMYNTEKMFKLPFAATKAPTLRIEKTSGPRLYYQTILDWFKVPRAGEKVEMQQLPAGLKVERKFYTLETAATEDNSKLVMVSKPFTGAKLRAGQTLLMKVLVDAPCSLPYVMLECPLPSGAEIVESNNADQAVTEGEEESGTPEDETISGDWGNQWWTHQDILDDKIVFFGTTLSQGKNEFHTLLRMELPGTLNVNPVRMEGMYTKMVRSYSQADSLSIVGQ